VCSPQVLRPPSGVLRESAEQANAAPTADGVKTPAPGWNTYEVNLEESLALRRSLQDEVAAGKVRIGVSGDLVDQPFTERESDRSLS
jgi:hypothetical protein